MIQWKKVMCTTLAVCALSTTCVAGAVEPVKVDGLLSGSVGNGGVEIEPLTEVLVVNHAITEKKDSWGQISGYKFYRVWVENTTKVQMKVTIKSSSASDSTVFYVPAGGSKTYTTSNAVSGIHTILFDTGTTPLSGTLRVRMSDAEFS